MTNNSSKHLETISLPSREATIILEQLRDLNAMIKEQIKNSDFGQISTKNVASDEMDSEPDMTEEQLKALTRLREVVSPFLLGEDSAVLAVDAILGVLHEMQLEGTPLVISVARNTEAPKSSPSWTPAAVPEYRPPDVSLANIEEATLGCSCGLPWCARKKKEPECSCPAACCIRSSCLPHWRSCCRS